MWYRERSLCTGAGQPRAQGHWRAARLIMAGQVSEETLSLMRQAARLNENRRRLLRQLDDAMPLKLRNLPDVIHISTVGHPKICEFYV